MNETQAQILLNFIDENWVLFTIANNSDEEICEDIRSKLEKIALGRE